MFDEAAEKLKADGWTIAETTGFLSLVGPLWQRTVNGQSELALITEDKHHNRRGMVQGGLLMTFADRACGMVARTASGRPTMATVQLDVHFVDAGKIGEVLIAKAAGDPRHPQPRLRDRRSDGERAYIITANGVFKILKDGSWRLFVSPVIASEAKQSRATRTKHWIASSQVLLAMTGRDVIR